MSSPLELSARDALRRLSPAFVLLGTIAAVIGLVIQSNAPAASTSTPGILALRNGDQFSSSGGYDRYSYLIVGRNNAAAAGSIATKALVYMSGTDVQVSWSTGVSYSEASAN